MPVKFVGLRYVVPLTGVYKVFSHTTGGDDVSVLSRESKAMSIDAKAVLIA